MNLAEPMDRRQLATRQRNQRGEGARLKPELVEAAMRILDHRPGVQLSLRMVAKEAGVAAPSVYKQFADAGTLFAEIVRECWAQMGAELAKSAEEAQADAPLAGLKLAMSAYVRYAFERPSRYQLLFALTADGGEEFDGLLRPAYRTVIETIERIAAAGGKLPAGDAVATALLVLSLAHGRIALAHLALNRRGNTAAGVEAFVLETLDLLFRQ